MWFFLNISHPVLLHHSCICAIVAVENQVAENEKSPCEKWKGTCSSLCWHPWALSVTLRLHLHNSLGFNRERLLIYICMCEKKLKSLRGCGSSVLQRIRSLLQKRTRYQSSKGIDAYFFTAFVFFVSMNYRSSHRHFQYRCGCSNYCLFFWRNLHLQNGAGYESWWTCCLKGPSVTSWSSKVRSSGMSCLVRQGLCLVGSWKV